MADAVDFVSVRRAAKSPPGLQSNVNQSTSTSSEPSRHVGCRPQPRGNALQPALWRRAVGRSWRQLLVSSLLMFAFAWVFVWLMSLVEWAGMMQLIPDFLKRSFGKDFYLFSSSAGQISLLFNHPITQLICIGWAVARGSDVVAGEIARGTMEHLLALPVRRFMVLLVPSVIAVAGAALLAMVTFAGLVVGLVVVNHYGGANRFSDLSASQFVPSAVNLGMMIFCMAGITTFFSAMDHDRWRVIWRAIGVFLVSMIVFTVGFLWPDGWWLKCLVFHGAYQPQILALKPDDVWTLPLAGLGGVTWPVAVWYNLILLALGLIAYALAAVIFIRRDIPVPR